MTALTGGDDYEPCFAVPPERISQLESSVAEWDCRLCTRIGVITAELGLQLARADGFTFHWNGGAITTLAEDSPAEADTRARPV